ncbi:MAG: restriction endonuclease subunit S [Candidatus Cloacimonetes bacterium]|nr:restriction endonuclease subunit S [Candidatus Cloacimonadota bacterium]
MSEMIKIPAGWESLELGNILKIETGSKNAEDSSVDGIYPFFTRAEETQKINTYSYDTEALFIAGEGNFRVKYYNGKFEAHQRTYVLTSKDDNIDLSYLQKAIQPKINRLISTSVGSTVMSLRKPQIAEIDVLSPKQKQEQQKIAEVLSEVDNAISKTEELFEKNKRLKTALMQDMLNYGVDENGKIRNPQTHQFKPSEIGDIPKEWNTEKLGNTKLFTLKTGGTPSTTKKEYWDNGNIRWMSSGEVNNKVITDTELKITELGYKSSSATLIPKFSILMALAGQGKTRGMVAINHVELSTNQSVAAIICNNKEISSQFLFYYLDSQYENLRNISYGAGRAGLSLTILREIEVIFPPLPEQQKIAQILSSQDEKIEDIINKLNKLKSLKASLMQDLLSGKVRVTKLMEENS